MIILSNRALMRMPDAETWECLDTDHFNATLTLKESFDEPWLPAPVEDSGLLRSIFGTSCLLIFGGYNQPIEGWKDSALNATRGIDSTLADLGCSATRVACLWPCRGQNLFEKIGFAEARRNAAKSAAQFVPFVRALLAAGVHVSLMGHSCGGFMAYLIASNVAGIKNVILMNAAMRQSEFDAKALVNAQRWLCFHSKEDSALKLMQADFVDQGASSRLSMLNPLNWFKSLQADEPIVGMHGIPCGGENIDLTAKIHADHSAARYIEFVMAEIAEAVGVARAAGA